MRSSSRSRTALSLALAAVVVVGCGRSDKHAADTAAAAQGDSAAPSDTGASASAATASQGSATAQNESAPLTVADIERWQRGMQAELEAVKKAGAEYDSAKTADDTLNAMSAASATETLAAGARAAGLDEERYKFVSTTLTDAVNNLAPMDQVLKTSDMPKEMVAQMQKGREAQLARMSDVLPPAVVDSLRPHAAELRKQSLTLAVARLKAIGQTPGGA